MIKYECSICNNDINNAIITVKELYGKASGDNFDYLECEACGCLALLKIDEVDFSVYYDQETYFTPVKRGNIYEWLMDKRNSYALRKKSLIGKMLFKLKPVQLDNFCYINDYIQPNSKILDVGCGSGSFLNLLRGAGYRNVSGIDPFIEKDIVTKKGVKIKKLYPTEVQDYYDVIFSHHSFEHVPNPLPFLIAMKNRLNGGGVLIIVIPTVEELYREYKEHCFLVQPPYHTYMYTIEGMKHLATRAGLCVERVERKETHLEWIKMSELWKKGIPQKNFNENENIDDYLTAAEIKKCEDLHKRLVNENTGDNVLFVMRKVMDSYGKLV